MNSRPAAPRRNARSVEAVDLHVGARIAARRQALGLSQTALGEMVGVSCQQVQKYEGGQNRISAARLHNLAIALSMPISAFFPARAEAGEPTDLSIMRTLAATPEGLAMAAGFAAIEDRSVRQALTQLVEVLSRAA
ncbi:MAG: helix-turn-helix domain-containing protein [Brevundimonas aurantiaca]|jgi:transcriptional regulator with XRE-family HTH domain|uniref:helix-turn-helix domain-containing protein n=1 Tax=Alphaproteobacteria TaxID=28211 RepID=UPI0006D03E7F|nr:MULTISPECIES: helix-turn-helix transcriptional regulator [Brevundimonas]KAK0343173.1 hypothetical protein LTR94_019263 [Friedmanniomyces endolithicus]MEC7797163.1 helix-turn-helix transcriptional regulator [Pseudomonadota bacterium]ALJ07471.1 DNA-binding protein [Brevundimonas sp. DS20]MCC4293982.1 helix-turn-helix domain-containing protein [Brevundimonas aurantiaca]MEC8532543.1 helix-turn-helix transcriptional regulator [Pseudomonadota bacterium]